MELRKIFLSEGVIMNRALPVIIFSFLFICLCSCSAESPEKHSQDIGNYNIVESVYTDNIDATNQKVSINQGADGETLCILWSVSERE